MQLTLLCWMFLAHAAEVVWLEPPTEPDRDRVADQAGATGPALEPLDLRAAATRWSEADQQAYDALDATLTEVRAYETRLDGELVIMRDLQAAVEKIGLVRDEADRNKLYAALAYQGFAVNRFFGTGLGQDPQAEPFRVELNGVVVERPWLDAVALDPDRDVTPYDIAEAPQRVAYGQVAEVVNGALTASLTPTGLPPGATLVVDGRPTAPGPAGNIKLVPGRHLVHLELDGRVIARWDVRLEPGQATTMGPEPAQDQWEAFLGSLADGAPVPDWLLPHLEALGGEVWIARPGERRPEVFAVDPEGIRAVTLERPAPEAGGSGGTAVDLLLGFQAGWFYSGDFYRQNPLPKNRTDATVNAVAVAGLVAVDAGMGPMHLSAGVQTWFTFGPKHVALSDQASLRLRPYPHLGVGLRPIQLTAGYLLPYHPAFGLRAALPLSGPIEVQASGVYGLAGKLAYPDSQRVYETADLRTLQAGLGLRF